MPGKKKSSSSSSSSRRKASSDRRKKADSDRRKKADSDRRKKAHDDKRRRDAAKKKKNSGSGHSYSSSRSVETVIPCNTESMIVFPLHRVSGKAYYDMIMFNPAQTEGVISKEEVRAILDRIQSVPSFHYENKPPPCVTLLLLAFIVGAIATIYYWFQYLSGQEQNVDGAFRMLITAYFIGLICFFYCRKQKVEALEAYRLDEIDDEIEKINVELQSRQIRFTDEGIYATLELDYITNRLEAQPVTWGYPGQAMGYVS